MRHFTIFCTSLLMCIVFGYGNLQAQNCSVNAGITKTICPNESFILNGTSSSTLPLQGSPVWSQISGPAVTLSATIVSGNTATSEVKNYSKNIAYTFRLTAKCQDGSTVSQDVTYTVSDVSIANAGIDQAVCPGLFQLQGSPLATGEVGKWSKIDGDNMPDPSDPASHNSTLSIPASSTIETAIYRWTVEKGGCSTFDDVVITNLGSQPVYAGGDILGLSCYNVTTSTFLDGSYAATHGPSGQKGTWTFVSGPSVPVFSNKNVHNTAVSNLIQGTYVLRWTVTGPCFSGSDDMTITVEKATQDVTNVPGGTAIYCDGRTSIVLNAPKASYAGEIVTWVKISGPGTPTIQSPNSNVTIVNGLDATAGNNYVFRYTITNPNTQCSSSGNYNVEFKTAPAINIASSNPYFISCGETEVRLNYSVQGGTKTDYALVSAPAGSAVEAIMGGINVFTTPVASGNVMIGFNKIGTYVIRYRRSTENTVGGCADAYKDVTIVISGDATASNAGTRQVLACNVIETSLAGNTPASGNGKWSQVKGPNNATFDNNLNPTAKVSGLVSGVYTFRWIISGGDGGCLNTQQDVDVVVSAVVPVSVAAGTAKTTCYGTPVTLEGNVPSDYETGTWTVTKGGAAAPEIEFSDIHKPTATVIGLASNTVYTFRWTIANACNSAFSEVQITTTSTIGPKQAQAGVDQCIPAPASSFTLAGNAPGVGETGNWELVSGPVGAVFTASQYNTTVTGAVSGTYLFKWSLSNGPCVVTSDLVQVTISAPATPANAGPDQNICGNSVVLAGNDPLVGTGVWTQTEGAGGVIINDPTAFNTNVSGLGDGRYKFTWTITSGACVTANGDDITINVSTPSTLADAGADQTLCNQTSTILDGNTISNGRGRWATVSGPSVPVFADLNNPKTSVSQLRYGVYELEWISTGGIYCSPSIDKMTITVTQNANAGTGQTLCDVNTVTLSGNPNSKGNWTVINRVPAGLPEPTVTPIQDNGAIVANLGTGTYTFRYTIAAVGTCPATSADVTYSISAPATTANAGPDQEICEQTGIINSVPLTANVPNPGEGTGTWSIADRPAGSTGTFSNVNLATAIFTPSAEGVYLLKWEIKNGDCDGARASSDFVRITISLPPTTAVAGADQANLCSNNVNLSANTPVHGLGTWTLTSGPNGSVINQPNSPTTTILNTVPGTYIFRWTIKNGVCLESFDEVEVIVSSIPPKLANAGVDRAQCSPAIGGISSVTLNGNQPSGAEGGLWTVVSAPAGIVPTFTNATLYNTNVNDLKAGTYTLRWTLNNGSCSSTDDVVITVVDPPSTAVMTSVNQTICLYQPVNLTAEAVTSGTGTWSTIEKPLNVPEPNFDKINEASTGAYGLVAGTYKFIFTTTNGICAQSASLPVTIIVTEPLTAASAGSDKTTCFNIPVALTAIAPKATETGTWTVSSGQLAADYEFSDISSATSTFKGKVAGTYTLVWTISNGACSSSASTTVVVQPELTNNQITATDQTICHGSTFQFTVTSTPTGGNNSYAYKWQRSVDGAPFADIAGATAITYTTATLNNTTAAAIVYRYLRLVNSGNCAQSESNIVTLTVNPRIDAKTAASVTSAICFSGATGTITGGNATGGIGTFSYQWQQALNTGAFTNILNATNADYDPGVLINSGSSIQTYKYRRVVSSGGCSVTGGETSIIVNPKPTLTSALTSVVCSNTTFGYSPISLVSGTTFTWTRALVTGISNIAATGAGPVSETLMNTTNTPKTVAYIFTLAANGCINPTTYTLLVTVNPSPVGTDATTTVACDGVLSYNLQTNVNSTVAVNSDFSWTAAPNNNVSGEGNGSTNTITQTLINHTNVPQQVVYTVVPTATTSGSCPGKSFTLTVTVPVCPGMQITKTTTRTTDVTQAGDVIPYRIVVSNTANTDQTNVVVTDPFLSALPLANPVKTGGDQDDVLNKGEVWTYTGNYTVTQADIDNNGKPVANSRQITNVATVKSTELPVPQTSGTTVNINAVSAYTVTKTSTVTQILAAGQIVPYQIEVKNTGNTAISNVVVNDPMLANLSLFTNDANSKLDQGETWIYTGSHTVTQAELDANGNVTSNGQLTNVVLVSGKKPDGTAVYATPVTSQVNIPMSAAQSFDIKKRTTTSAITKVGQVVPYTITVANTGKVAIPTLTVTDPLLPTLTLYSGDIAPLNGKLDVNETWTYTGSYTVTQADLDNNGKPGLGTGILANQASATVTYPNGSNETKTSNRVDVPITPFAAYTIEKTADKIEITAAGQNIEYTITVKNNGDVAIKNVVVNDPMLSLSLPVGDTNINSRLDVGETWIYTGIYTVKQVDVDNNGNDLLYKGSISNTATVSGQRPDNSSLTPLPATRLIPLNTSSAFTVVKTADKSAVKAAGETVNYTITVRNTGTVAINTVVMTDPMLTGITGPTGDTNADSKLDLTETWIYRGAYIVSQTDINNQGNLCANGKLSNTANVTGKKPDGSGAGSVTSLLDIPIDPLGNFSLTKVSDVSRVNKAGDLVKYTVTARNTGAVAINSLLVNDPMINLIYQRGDLNLDGKLDLSENWIYEGTYTVTQSDIDNNGNGTVGKMINTVTATGRKPDGTLLPVVSATNELDVNSTGTISVVKASAITAVTKAGQIIPYTITVNNTGTVAIANVVVKDPMLLSTPLVLTNGDTNADDKLDVKETWTYAASYVVTQDDIDNFGNGVTIGNLVNVATVTGTSPNGPLGPVSSNIVTIPVQSVSAYSIEKTSITDEITVAGQLVPYIITVTNAGNSAIANIVVNDAMLSGTPLILSSGDGNSNGKLDVTETWTYLGSYEVKQSDIDQNGNTITKGVLSNIASVSGTAPDGTALGTITSARIIPLVTSSSFTVNKIADKASVTKAGDIINYTINVANTGDVAISNVNVNDPLTGGVITTVSSGDTNSNGILDVSETWTYRASYTVTQSDIDKNGNTLDNGTATANGNMVNTVTVTGKKPDGTSAGIVTALNVVPISPTAAFALSKTSNVSQVSKAGDQVLYTVTATNTGAVAINTFVISDPMVALTYQSGDTNTDGKLDVSESWTFTGLYTVKQTDIDNHGNGITTGKLVNRVSANGRKPDGSIIPDVNVNHALDISALPAMTVKKASSTTLITRAGQVVTYAITVANTGTVAIANVAINDPLLNDITLYSGDVNGNGIMDVRETWTFTGTYTVGQADLDNFGKPTLKSGTLVNTASASGRLPNTTPINGTSNTVTIPIQINTLYTIEKNSATTAITHAGQPVPYIITVKNIGDAAISDVVITDAMLNVSLSGGDANGNSKLDVAETWTYTGTYIVKQTDVDNNGNTSVKGVLTNTASLTGKKPDGTAVGVLTSTKVIPLSTSSLFTVTKTADKTVVTKAGDIINYTITVTNTAVTAITTLKVNDPVLGGIIAAPSAGDLNSNGILDVAEAWTYNGDYIVTQADIDRNGNTLANNHVYSNGNIVNVVSVTGNKPDGAIAGTVTAVNEVPINPTATFTLSKTSNVTQVSKAGDQVLYTVIATNTGAVAISTFVVNDPMVGLTYQSGDINNNGKIDVTERWTFTGLYTVRQTDIDNYGNGVAAGKLVNKVTANGRKPDGSIIPDVSASHSLDINAVPAMTVKKASSTTLITNAGQVVTYAITVANTGTVAIADVAINDPLLSNITLYSGDVNGNGLLDVRETWTFTGIYAVTQADIDNFGKPILKSGTIVNTASASGILPNADPILGISNTVIIPIQTNTVYSLEKSSVTTEITNAGQQVPYIITVKNIGYAAISDVVISDAIVNVSLLNGDTNGNSKLDVAEIWTYAGTYIVKQTDIDNNGNTSVKGVLSNTASLTGKKPDGTAVGVLTSTKVIPLNTSTLFTVTKTADKTVVTKAGDVINYTITVTNTAATAITMLKVNDPVLGGIIAAPSTGDLNSNGVLDVAEAWTYSGNYTVTQADIDRNGNTLANNHVYSNGNIVNVVSVTGNKPDGSIAGTVTAINEVPINPTATFTLSKTSNVAQVSKAGDQVLYTVTAINTGAVAISTFVVNDPMVGLTYQSGDINNNGKIDVIERWTYTGVYKVTQADIDNNGNGVIVGKLVNTVSAAGRKPDGTSTGIVTATATVDMLPLSALRIVKSSTTTLVDKAGQLVPYSIIVANTGTVAISNINVTDPMLANLTYDNGDINGNSKLDVNETWTYKGSYIVTQADIDNKGNTLIKGSLVNTAVVSGNNPDGSSAGVVSSTKNIPVQQKISLEFTKVATGQIGYIAGQTVTYELKVTNNGNTTLKNIVLTDVNAVITNGSPIAQLEPGQQVLVTAVHILTQADVDAGKVINQAKLTGQDPEGNPVDKKSDDPSTTTPEDATVTQIVSPGSITLVKTAQLSGDGNTITYNFTVKNTGIVTLSNINISDTKIVGAIAVNPSTLAPGTSGTASAVYTITAIEKAAEQVSNTAIVTGTSPNGFKVNDVSGTNENNNTPTMVVLPKIAGTKTVRDANANGIIEAGELLTYTITIANNGDVDRTGVSVSDPVPAHTIYVAASANNNGTINANVVNWSNLTIPANGNISLSFRVNAIADLPLGLTSIVNTASIINPAQPGTPVVVETNMPTEGKLESVKTVNDAKGNKDGIAQANEVLTYGIEVKNSGGSALTGIKITDVIPMGLNYVGSSANNGGTFTTGNNMLNWLVNLAPGAVVNLTFDATVAADVNGIPEIKNVAEILSSTGQSLQPSAKIDVDPSVDLVVTKQLLTPSPIRTGDRITYQITVLNAGQNKATGVKVSDVLPGTLDAPIDIVVDKGSSNYVANSKTLNWTIGDLALNETVSITFKTRVVATGSIVNIATVTGDQLDKNTSSNRASSQGSEIGGEDLLIPNLFTPNGDGNNDSFEIRGLGQFADNELAIVNRWGNEVFRTRNYQNNWTGEGLNEGTYYYVLRVQKPGSTEWKVFKGYITLVRAFKK